MSIIYSAQGIGKRFGSNLVLDDVDFAVRRGAINGLVGANGAGKSTLLKIIVGALRPDAGLLELDGEPLELGSVHDAAAAGIAMVSQELSLFPALSIEENLLMAPGGRGWSDRKGQRERASAILARLGVDQPLATPVEALPLADRQLVEIARALLQQPRVLILDEPTSSLQVSEVEQLHAILRALRDEGIGIIYVSHFLEELLDIADTLTVLRGGRRIPLAGRPTLDTVVGAMLGERPAAGTQQHARGARPVATDAAQGLRIKKLLGDTAAVDGLVIAPGQITAVAGLQGAGMEELFQILFGNRKPRVGDVTLPSGSRLPRSMAAAVAAGVAYVPADRKSTGLMLRQTISENIASVKSLALKRNSVLMHGARMQADAMRQVGQLGIKCASVTQPVGELSGGNQQKVVFAKWLEAEPSLLLLDDPTRGVDIAAREEMHQLVRRLAEEGMVILFYSSDPAETVALADRVLVFVDGRIRHDLAGADLTEHELVAAMNTSANTDTAA